MVKISDHITGIVLIMGKMFNEEDIFSLRVYITYVRIWMYVCTHIIWGYADTLT